MKNNLLFFTVANKDYYKFVPVYIFFALINNKNSCIEVCVESRSDFYHEHGSAMDWLEEYFPSKIRVRESSWFGKIRPNSIRFVETPITREFDYVYIGDVDIIIFDKDIVDIHLKNMQDFGIPFSNIVRPKTIHDRYPRLTGCHFAPAGVQYPIADISDLDVVGLNDERILHEVLVRKGYKLPADLKRGLSMESMYRQIEKLLIRRGHLGL